MKRTDERDIMFARMQYKPGTPQYKDYYSRHPEKKEIDDELRARSELFSKETPTFDDILSPAADANFNLLSDIRHFCEGDPASEKAIIDPSEAAKTIKNLIRKYGAVDTAITNLDEEMFYTQRGRLPESYGEKVDSKLKNAIVFTVRMDEGPVNTAPAISQSVETSRAYVETGIIGLQISYLIRGLGYNARCHMDGNYLLPMVPAAIKAGLGERGRHGLLVSSANGCFVRIGAVTTDMPLEFDIAEPLDIARFCKICRRCIKTCPAQTISDSLNPDDWHIDQELCYGRWRHLGTDCGICISTCPLGQDLHVKDIAGMSNKEINTFIEEYNLKYGTRKRTIGKYFR